jgi:superfamily II DNA/RNA helicase
MSSTFSQFHLLESLQATLTEKGLTTPTEIQVAAIPSLLIGESVVGVAETGTGKTLAYALPILHQLKSLENAGDKITMEGRPRAAVIVPTRELGEQVARVFKPFTHTTRLRVRTVLGGTTFDVSKRNCAGSFEILVATPGRLVKLMEKKRVTLKDVRVLVFDEADQMLDKSFIEEAGKIVADCPAERQMALFSATVSAGVQTLMKDLFEDARVIRSENSRKLVPGLKTVNREVVEGEQMKVLEELLETPVQGGTMIFANTRKQVDGLVADLAKSGRSSVIYRGEMDKVERRANLKKFREGQVELLISTDLAGRGLDVEHVGRVINYRLPQQVENYVHRVGRTARAGRKGLVINFVTDRDRELMKQVDGLRS